MMMTPKLVFATNNQHKVQEVQSLLDGIYIVLSLPDIGCTADIPETGSSFRENAALKTKYVQEHFGLDCFADDSGLEVAALNNEPGIFSARYSGVRDDKKNMALVLEKLTGVSDRRACFKTAISLRLSSEEYFFEGVVNGHIIAQPVGDQGFGYDPVFMPEGYTQTFAQMSMAEKNAISHRALAMQKLIAFLKG
jgi:XTP/dITP diphosphohydrolase